MTKATKQMMRIHNIETNEIIDREMTEEEIAELETKKLENELLQAEAVAKETAKTTILERIGLTADELKMILG